MKTRRLDPTSCYFSPEEKRMIQQIAEKEERPACQVVQFAVRAFWAQWGESREKALALAQRQERANAA